MRSGRTLSALAIATALGLAATTGAQAQGTVSTLTIHGAAPAHGTEVKNENIKVSDLNLKSDAGAETLVGRLRGAATRVCKPKPTSGGNFRDVEDYNKCRDDAVRHAVQDLGDPTVQAVFDRTGD